MRRALPILLCTLLSGCAGYAIQKDGEGKGYDIYSPDPYLLRTPMKGTNGEITGFTFEVTWLPNRQKRYRVHSWAGLGKAEFEFNYTNGWQLTKTVDKADNTKILDSLLDLTKHLIPANPFSINDARIAPSGISTMDALARQDLRDASMSPVLYRIEFDEVSGCCVGLRPVGAFPACGEFPVGAVSAKASMAARPAAAASPSAPAKVGPAAGMN